MNNINLDSRTANKEANSGIQAAELNANIKNRDWTKMSRSVFKRWLRIVIRRKNKTFMIEDFRKFAQGKLPNPPHNRAFGGLPRHFRDLGLIQHVGFRKTKSTTAHGATASIWEAV